MKMKKLRASVMLSLILAVANHVSPVMAADPPADPATEPVVAPVVEPVHYVHVNAGESLEDNSNYDLAHTGAKGSEAIAIGKNAYAGGAKNISIGDIHAGGRDTIAIGSNFSFIKDGGTVSVPGELADGAIVIGKDITLKAPDKKAFLPNSILIGQKNTLAPILPGSNASNIILMGKGNTIRNAAIVAIGNNNDLENHLNQTANDRLYVYGEENSISNMYGLVIGKKNFVNTADRINFQTETGKSSEYPEEDVVGTITQTLIAGSNNAVGIKGAGINDVFVVGNMNRILSDHNIVYGELNAVNAIESEIHGSFNKVGLKDARTNNSLAVGVGNQVDKDQGVALGSQNELHGRYALGMGYGNISYGGNTVVSGRTNRVSREGLTEEQGGNNSAVFGLYNHLTGSNSTALGLRNNTLYDAQTKNWNDVDSGFHSAAVGLANRSSGKESLAFGRENESSGVASTAFGEENTASGVRANAIGSLNFARGEKSIAVGIYNNYYSFIHGWNKTLVAGDNSAAMGLMNTALGHGSTAVGNQNLVMEGGLHAVSMGFRNFTSQLGSVAIGSENNLSFNTLHNATGVVQDGFLSTAVGISNMAMGARSVAMGNGTSATMPRAVAFGSMAQADGVQSLALGRTAIAGYNDEEHQATSLNNVAIGTNTISLEDDSVALGSFSVAAAGTKKGAMGYNPVTDSVIADYTALGKAAGLTDAEASDYANGKAQVAQKYQDYLQKQSSGELALMQIQSGLKEDNTPIASKEEYAAMAQLIIQRQQDMAEAAQAWLDAQKALAGKTQAWESQLGAVSIGNTETGLTWTRSTPAC